LTITTPDGLRHTWQAERPDVTDAARQAADLFPSAISERSDDLGDLLQRAEAALLANQLGTARSILGSTPEHRTKRSALCTPATAFAARHPLNLPSHSWRSLR
jgi:hypothetical protein